MLPLPRPSTLRPRPRAQRRGRRQGAAGAALVLAGSLLASHLSPLVAQQTIQGRVTAGDSGLPLEGAMVVLLPEGAERTVTRFMTGREGNFRLAVPEPGRYQVRVDRIGFASTYSEVIEVAAGATVQLAIEAAVLAISLPGLTVQGGERRCDVRPEEGLATSLVWDEARKALEAAAWTAERGLYSFVWTRYVRDVAADGRRIRSEERSFRDGRVVQPFASLDPEVLRERGYVETRPEGTLYTAPDANVLLSDAFLDTHCFGLERRQEQDVTLIGLRFEPIRGRSLPEVEGVLWLEEDGARLRSLEYRYVNLEYQLAQEGASGELTFRELPDGTWIVHEWRIRMPLIQGERDRSGNITYHAVGYRDEGGQVNRVASAGGQVVDEEPAGRWLRGAVADSLGRPAEGARVWIEGTGIETLTDARGNFAVPGLGPGVWGVAASHPALEGAGHAGVVREVEIGRTDVAGVLMELPSVQHFAEELCRGTPPSERIFDGRNVVGDDAKLLGRVVDRWGAPVAGARVSVHWNRYLLPHWDTTTDRDPVIIGENTWDEWRETDEDGRFAFCTVPQHRTIAIRASLDEAASAPLEIWIDPEDRVAVATVVLIGP